MLCHAVLVDLERRKPWHKLKMEDADRQHLEHLHIHLARYEKDIADFDYHEAA